MKKEWLLLIAATLVSALIALGLIRWLAPGLLGISRDLQLVQVSKEVPPFYDNVFRDKDRQSAEFILQDPNSISRAKPLFPDQLGMGPNDLLGFRNRSIPNVADIVTIGDSQTYGNNAVLEDNWPSRLRAHLRDLSPVVYNMSCGAWGGPQYLEMARKALYFQPRVLVVAFYTGNDPVSSFTNVYGAERWADLRQDPDLVSGDAPKVDFPPPPSEMWMATFADGSATVFTPNLRLASNLRDNPAVRTGWSILEEVARRIVTLAEEAGARPVFTIIPTKELVYSERVRRDGLAAPVEYSTLVASEKEYLIELASALRQLPGAGYADVLQPLQESALQAMLYPSSQNGHPVAAGYDVIARAVASTIRDFLPPPPRGLVFVQYPDGASRPILAREGGFLVFESQQVMVGNGWASQPSFSMAAPRDIAALRYQGTISTVEPDRYGPQSLH